MNSARTLRILTAAGTLLLLALLWPTRSTVSNRAARVEVPTASTVSQPNPAATRQHTDALPNPVSSAAPPKPVAVEITAFNDWFLAFRRGESPPLALGAQLARARRAALKALIATNPETALAHAVPRSLRRELPVEMLAELETPIDAFGQFEVAITCFATGEKIFRTAEIAGSRYQAHVFGRRHAALSKNRLPIHGIALDDQLAIDDAPYRRLDDSETGLDPQNESEIRVAIGGEVHAFASARDLKAWNDQAMAAEAIPGPDVSHANTSAAAALPPNWTFGEKSVLWIRAEFADDPGSPASDAAITAAMAEVDQFYRDVSHGRCSLRPIILPGVLRLTRTKAAFANNEAYYFDLRDEARALARSYDAANGGTGLYNPDQADRYIVVCKSVPSFGFMGIAAVGTTGVLLNGTLASDVAAHELGHNHGLYHAHAWIPTAGSPVGTGTHSSYGDVFDDMGNTARVPTGHFNAKHKETLLYLDATNITNVTTAGTYRIFRHDHRDASGVQALRIGAGDYELWLEHRQQIPRPNFPEPDRLRSGLQMRWGRYPKSLPGTGTYLLDLTPNTPNTMDDAPALMGEKFTDITAGLTITPIATGGTAPREWIDVRIDYGATGGSNRNPVLAASAPVTVLPARTDITFTASAYDPDGDPVTIRWDFGDGNPLAIAPNVTHRFNKGGPVTVVASAIDGKGGLATKSFDLLIDDPLTAWTPQGGAQSLASFNAVIHDGRQFLAAGLSSLYTSPNGSAWTRRTAIPGLYPQELAVAGSTYVAVGYASNSGTAGAIAQSTDGLTWRTVTPATPPPLLESVAFGAGRFVAVGKSGTMLQSIDGVTWASLPALTTQDLRGITFAAGRFAIAGNAGTILTSPDGLVWTNRSFSTGASITFVVHHLDKWVVGNGPNIWTSPDTLTWTPARSDSSRPIFNKALSLGANGLIVPNLQNDNLFISEDGLIWDPVPIVTPVTSGGFRAAATSGDTVVVVSLNGRIFQARSRSAVASAPQIAVNPQPQFVPVGRAVSLTIGPSAVGTTYQWARNGDPIPGATNPILAIANAQPGDNGSYTVTLTNFSGSTTSAPASLAVDPNTARLVNLSIRSRAGSGADVFTMGFVVGRSFYTNADPATVKPLLTRGIGPALTGFGVSGALVDPKIDFFDGATRIGSNDDWGAGTTSVAMLTDTFRRVGAFELVAGSKDSALLTNFAPKPYTVQLTGANNGTGSALAELYDLDTSVTATRLTNVSARAVVGTAPDLLIGGFVLAGEGRRTVLIRAVGPTLAVFGVPGILAQPIVTLFSGDQTVANNAGWSTSNDTGGLKLAAERVGAFALPDGSQDSALLASLGPGAYTIQVSGTGGTTGVALLEIYEVP